MDQTFSGCFAFSLESLKLALGSGSVVLGFPFPASPSTATPPSPTVPSSKTTSSPSSRPDSNSHYACHCSGNYSSFSSVCWVPFIMGSIPSQSPSTQSSSSHLTPAKANPATADTKKKRKRKRSRKIYKSKTVSTSTQTLTELSAQQPLKPTCNLQIHSLIFSLNVLPCAKPKL